jgi:hypothetical protein
MRIKYDQPTAACATHRKPVYPDVGAAFDRLVDLNDAGVHPTPEQVARMFRSET